MRPRVLYVTPMFGYPPLGGPRLRTYHTLQALARLAEVNLYVTQQPDTRDRDAARAHMLGFCREVVWPEATPEVSMRLRRIVPQPVRAALRGLRHAIAPVRRDPDPQTLPRDALVAALEAYVEQHPVDVIWLGFGGISYDLVPLKQRTRLPLVLETECVWSRFILRELPFAASTSERERIQREGRAKEEEERIGARAVDITTATSDVDADYFRALAPEPERVMLIHNVVDVDAYAADQYPPVDLAQPALVFAGSLSRGTANVDAALWLLDEIVPRIWRNFPSANVYLVGRDPAPEIVARRGERVHVTGEVPSIVPYLRACAAAIVPLRWESGTRFKILEAFASRAPVISTTLGAEGLAVEQERHLLLADDADAFSAAVCRILDDPSVGQRLVEPAYELVRREYDVDAAERQIAAVLERLGVLSAVRA